MNLTRLAVLTVATILMSFSAAAQTFTQRVQQHRSGEGTVVIHHDADIDLLVNAASAKAAKPAPASHAAVPTKPAAPTKSAAPTKPAAPTKSAVTSTKSASPAKSAAPVASAPKAKAEKSKKPQDDTTRTKPVVDTTDTTIPVAENDTTTLPLAPRHAYKTTGYRVQAFAGGNTRHDRQKAERTGNAIRQLFPGEDVYVRFYSPRWVCRVGNYRTYEEAHEKMMAIRKMGYESATIVKGKIIVYSNSNTNP